MGGPVIDLRRFCCAEYGLDRWMATHLQRIGEGKEFFKGEMKSSA
jgi:hypothetical protein